MAKQGEHGITWTKILDRDGRRIRWYRRKRPGPRRNIRLLLDQFGLRWCRSCEQWLIKKDMRTGLCRLHRNAEYRRCYAEGGGAAIRERVYARKRNSEPIASQDRAFISESFNGQCAYCGSSASTLDHVIPVTGGGDSRRGNLLPACFSCNSRKGTRHLDDFLHTCIAPNDLIAQELCMAEVL